MSAIYFDLDLPLPARSHSQIEQGAARVRKQQWFDASPNPSDTVCTLDPAESTLILELPFRVGCEIELPTIDPRLGAADSPSADAGFSLELNSLDPSTLALVLEFASGESWEIRLATLDGGPFETTAFASDGAAFFLNLIEWSEDGEVVALDADFEVELADGRWLGGRILWNAPWTPDEEPFVPLSDDDWANAWPGEVSIEGPDLRLLAHTGWVEEWLDSASTERLAQICSGGSRADPSFFDSNFGFLVSHKWGTQSVDSIRYSRDLATDPKAARIAVERDVDSLVQENQGGAAARSAQAIEVPTSARLEVASSAGSNFPTPLRFPSIGAGFSVDLTSPDPSTLTLILKFAFGKTWKIQLVTPHGGPLEPTDFASDEANFSIHWIDWGEDGELVALDADFKVEFADGDSAGGNIRWNAPRARGEEPSVSLTRNDSTNASPGETSPAETSTAALRRDSLTETQAAPAFWESESWASEMGNTQRLNSISYSQEPETNPKVARNGDGQRVKSINYSREPASDSKAAREAVAPDVESLAQENRTGDEEREEQATEGPTSIWFGFTSSAGSTPPTPPTPPHRPPDSKSARDQQAVEIASQISPRISSAGLEDREPTEVFFEQEPIDWAALASSVAVAWNSEPEVPPDDTKATGSASKISPTPARFVRDAADAVAHPVPLGDTVSLWNRIEVWWHGVRTIADYWVRGIFAFMLETDR